MVDTRRVGPRAIRGGGGERPSWLAAAEAPADDAPGRNRLLGALFAALLLLAAAVGLGWWLSSRSDDDGGGRLIAAPAAPYRVPAPEAGGMAIEGRGDTAYPASEGADPCGRIDLAAVPEEPVAAPPAPEQAPPAPAGDAPPVPTPAPAAPGAVQLGAFPSEAAANRAWESLSGRFAALAPLAKEVQPYRDGDRTLYRLRADAGSGEAARALCASLRVAGERCAPPGH